MQALRYPQALPTYLGIVKGPWGAGKTYLDVVVTLLLLCQGAKVKVFSPSSKSFDTFIKSSNSELTRLRDMGIEVTNEKAIGFHSTSTESQIVAVKSSKNRRMNHDRLHSSYVKERSKSDDHNIDQQASGFRQRSNQNIPMLCVCQAPGTRGHCRHYS